MPANLKFYELHKSPLYKMQSRKKLANLLFISQRQLKRLSGDAMLYRQYPIKKNGKSRQVDEPRGDLKAVQRRIAELLGRIDPPDFLFCPVKRRSHISNAAHHRENRVVHSLDVKKYFPSARSQRVHWFFHKIMLCSTDVAAVLAKIACVDGHLPTGSPLSPIMAYYAHVDIWHEVASLARDNGCKLSVYIDDMTVSGMRVPLTLIWKMKKVIHGGGLRYHKEKRAVDRRAEITGVIKRDGRMLVANRHRVKLRELKKEKDSVPMRKVSKSLVGQLAGMQGLVDQIKEVNERYS